MNRCLFRQVHKEQAPPDARILFGFGLTFGVEGEGGGGGGHGGILMSDDGIGKRLKSVVNGWSG